MMPFDTVVIFVLAGHAGDGSTRNPPTAGHESG